ncbi:hypothetical protein ACFVUW_10835 [Streptomyces xiamenensis]
MDLTRNIADLPCYAPLQRLTVATTVLLVAVYGADAGYLLHLAP